MYRMDNPLFWSDLINPGPGEEGGILTTGECTETCLCLWSFIVKPSFQFLVTSVQCPTRWDVPVEDITFPCLLQLLAKSTHLKTLTLIHHNS